MNNNSMFVRSDKTYDIKPGIFDSINRDEAHPLNRICRFIPEGSKILDVGAGNGLLAQLFIKNNKKIIVDGIEPNPHAAVIAEKYYRHFYHGRAQEFFNTILKENYDYIVLADVIEHIQDPLAFLLDLCSKLPDNSRLILSIPNVAFGAIRLSLLHGVFDYVDSGILEKTHVRFFTLKTIIELVAKINMQIETLFYLQKDIFKSEIPIKKNIANFFCYLQMYNDDIFSTYQFLLVLTKEPITTPEIKRYGQKTRSIYKHFRSKLISSK